MKARKSGFTLVELLVVIGIIALLISILLPSLNKARASAQRVACLSNLRQLWLTTAMYQAEFKGFVPVPTSNGTIYPDGTKEDDSPTIWYNALPRYFRQSPMGTGGLVRQLDTYKGGASVFQCPAATAMSPLPQRRTYAMNKWCTTMDSWNWTSHGSVQWPIKLEWWKKYSLTDSDGNGVMNYNDIPIYTDGMWKPDRLLESNFCPQRWIGFFAEGRQWSDFQISRPHTFGGGGSGYFGTANAPMVKPGGINAVFMDGHADFTTWREDGANVNAPFNSLQCWAGIHIGPNQGLFGVSDLIFVW